MYAAEHESAPRQMTEAEYRALEEKSEIKHEYSRGIIYAMTGGSVRHNTITVNVSTQFNVQLADKDCTVNSPDTKVYIAAKQTYRYPDVTVFCGDPAYVQDRTDIITNPVLLVEVLSPETMLADISEKLEEYTQIASLQAYLRVAQDRSKVESYMRGEADDWVYRITTGLESELHLPSLDCTLALSKIYAKVRWDEDADEQL